MSKSVPDCIGIGGGVPSLLRCAVLTIILLRSCLVDAAPPEVTILSPTAGTVFHVGQIFHLRGQAIDALTGEKLDSSKLRWEVQYHYDVPHDSDENNDHDRIDDGGRTFTFMEPQVGNNIVLRPAPRPPVQFFPANSNKNSYASFLRIILQATDPSTGDVSVTERILYPSIVSIDVGTVPEGLVVIIDESLLLGDLKTALSSQSIGNSSVVSGNNKDKDLFELQMWKGSELVVQTGNQRPYTFSSWSDGSTDRKRKIKLTEDYHEIVALFCLHHEATCQTDVDCCSGACSPTMGCVPPDAEVVQSLDGTSRIPRSIATTVSLLTVLAFVIIVTYIVESKKRHKKLCQHWGIRKTDIDDGNSNSDINSHNNSIKDNHSSNGETDVVSNKHVPCTVTSTSVNFVEDEEVQSPPRPSQVKILANVALLSMRSIYDAGIRKLTSRTEKEDGITPISDATRSVHDQNDAECGHSDSDDSVYTSSCVDDRHNQRIIVPDGDSKIKCERREHHENREETDVDNEERRTIEKGCIDHRTGDNATASVAASIARSGTSQHNGSSSSDSDRSTLCRRSVSVFMYTELE